MRIGVGVVGRPRDRQLAAAIDDYERRAARYWPLDVWEVKGESARSTPPDTVRRREGERLRARLAPGTMVVACEEGGTAMTSPQFSRWLQHERERGGGRDVAFLIGGAFGLAEELVRGAATRLALAPWTLPHELARLVLAEQLYRAGTIVRGEPYHK
jgi:23S rRNA (pseudouridine1915-N3)-methyltransferase